jgi:energy-coupling factor transporter ATP-binding protein EcfA2
MLELSGRPLIDTASDRRLYTRRDEHGPLVYDARQRLNVLLGGDRGSGKTTLLRQILLDLRNEGEKVVFVDGKAPTDAVSFLELIRQQMANTPDLPGRTRSWFGATLAGADGGELGRILDLLDSIRAAAADGGRITLLVDGLPSPTVAHELFGRMRDELWQLPFNWVIAVDSRERAALMEPPADAFFDRLLNLRPLTTPQSVALLEHRVDGQSRQALERLAEAGEGNPRVLLALARDALEGGRAVEDLLDSRARRETLAAQVSRPASMLLAELESMGAASASDEELLKRLGWTRPRASQVFSELEAAGLVTSREVKGHGGRPRKVFQVERSPKVDG